MTTERTEEHGGNAGVTGGAEGPGSEQDGVARGRPRPAKVCSSRRSKLRLYNLF